MKVRDPVCGMQFDESEAAETVEYRGRTYAFCSAHCKDAFEEDPDRYIESDE